MLMKTPSFFALLIFSGIVFIGGFSTDVQAQQTVDNPQTINSGVKTQTLWKSVNAVPQELEQNRYVFARQYKTFEINMDIMDEVVALTARPGKDDERKVITLMFIPMPDGNLEPFQIWNDPVMHPDLADRYPEIQTFAGRGISNPASTIRMDKTPEGVHVQILRPEGTVFVDPYAFGNDQYYISYLRRDFQPHPLKIRNEIDVVMDGRGGPDNGEPDNSGPHNRVPDLESGISLRSSGEELRTYRLALACTGEYADFHGGTVSGALAAMATSMNRINGIYEREFSVRMELVANNDLIVFLDGDTDPYSNSNGAAMLGQNQTTVDAVIGTDNYDLGHVFSTGGGGIASFGSVCSGDNKAQGVTGGFAPVGDPFDVDYVAHELGHQFRGEHSFNFCGSTSGIGSTDFEPGSGSTIMGYAGICGGDDYETNSDDYFHGANLSAMTNFVTSGSGSTCGILTPTANTAPEFSFVPTAYTIPISTPFELTANAIDAEGDVLTYCWEQKDGLNNVSLLANPSGTFGSPLFRSFPPVISGTRVFPGMNLLVSNTTSRVEFLPDYQRSLRFQVTVRDNHPGSGGAAWDDVILTVDETGGPFFITEPEGSGVVWQTGNWFPVSWQVGATNAAPFECATVRILLSQDGGYTYPVVLHESVPNNGSTVVYVPDLPGDDVRIKIACNENIFFQINNANIRIENTGVISGLDAQADGQTLKLFPNPASSYVQIDAGKEQSLQGATLHISDYTGRTVLIGSANDALQKGLLTVRTAGWSSGVYLVALRFADGRNRIEKLVVE